MFRTRFAPSPTGPLHLGHAYSAIIAFEMASDHDGAFLLRIEDTDQSRCRPEWEAQIYDDLRWLGLEWEQPVRRQSDHIEAYTVSLEKLADQGLLFPCSCSRADINAALSAPQEGSQVFGPDGAIYPGTCRHRAMSSKQDGDALRLNMAAAIGALGQEPLSFKETGPENAGTHVINPQTLPKTVGDVVLARKDVGDIAYHLAVTLDDADQDITHVVRGADLFEATTIHVLLQALLGLPTPVYHHHRLIRDETGKRLAKRHDAAAIAKFRAEGATPADIRQMVGLPA